MKLNYLLTNPLFINSDKKLLIPILKSSNIIFKTYPKDSIIVQEYDICNNISFIIEGSLYINQLLENGETLRINLYKKEDVFGCAMFGGNNKHYPFTLISNEESKIIHIPFDTINMLIKSDYNFMMNFISYLSNNILLLKEKIKILSLKSLRNKLMFYLNKHQKNGMIHLNHTKTELSKILGVSRGSISRELKQMQEDNIIKILDNKTILLIKH